MWNCDSAPARAAGLPCDGYDSWQKWLAEVPDV